MIDVFVQQWNGCPTIAPWTLEKAIIEGVGKQGIVLVTYETNANQRIRML